MTELRVERAGPALWLTIDREERRNAVSAEVLRGMLDAVAGLDDPAVRAIVVTGAGERVFCSGADLTAGAGEDAGELFKDLVLAMRACPVPVIARVQGLCLAGGVGLAAATDVVLASSAAEFGLPEARLGLWPFLVSALLARTVSPKHALDLMLTGERIDAAAAHRIGLVSRVLPAQTFDVGVAEYVARVAQAAPLAVRLGKAALVPAQELPLEPALDAMRAQLAALAASDDAREGVAAFREKRAPRWTGR